MIYPAGSVGEAMVKQSTTVDVSPDVVPVTQTAPVLDPEKAWPFPAATPEDFETLNLNQE